MGFGPRVPLFQEIQTGDRSLLGSAFREELEPDLVSQMMGSKDRVFHGGTQSQHRSRILVIQEGLRPGAIVAKPESLLSLGDPFPGLAISS